MLVDKSKKISGLVTQVESHDSKCDGLVLPDSISIVHAVGAFLPESTGGTEVFVASLVECLNRQDRSSSVVVMPSNDLSFQTKLVHGITVLSYPADRPFGVVDNFARALRLINARVYHHHGWQPDLDSRQLHCAKSLGYRTVLTLHTSFAFCMRQDFMYLGRRVCTAPLYASRCTTCFMQSRGAGRLTSNALTHLPRPMRSLINRLAFKPQYRTATKVPETVVQRLDGFSEAIAQSDRLTVFADWQAQLVTEFGADVARLRIIRHGKAQRGSQLNQAETNIPYEGPDVGSMTSREKSLRCVYIGRMVSEKGVDLLFDAWRLLSKRTSATLDLWGPLSSEPGCTITRSLNELAASDDRVRWHGTVPPGSVTTILARHADVVLVPSRWMETGPLVVLDAFEAGVPVVGSNRGGIRELVRDNVDGRLVFADQAQQWATVIQELADSPSSVNFYRRMVRKPRSMSDVAADFSRVYAEIESHRESERLFKRVGVGHHSGSQWRDLSSGRY